MDEEGGNTEIPKSIPNKSNNTVKPVFDQNLQKFAKFPSVIHKMTFENDENLVVEENSGPNSRVKTNPVDKWRKKSPVNCILKDNY